MKLDIVWFYNPLLDIFTNDRLSRVNSALKAEAL